MNSGVTANVNTRSLSTTSGASASASPTATPTTVCSAIGDYVWFDENGDGIQDPTEHGLPDITVTDNAVLGNGAAAVAQALETLGRLGLQGEHFKRLAARVVLGFAGETLPDRELDALVREA